MNKYIVFASMGLELVGLMLASSIVGKQLDQTYGTNGIVLTVLCLLSLFGWLAHIIYLTKKLEQPSGQDDL